MFINLLVSVLETPASDSEYFMRLVQMVNVGTQDFYTSLGWMSLCRVGYLVYPTLYL